MKAMALLKIQGKNILYFAINWACDFDLFLRLTRNFTASTTFGGIVKPQKTVESKPRNISSSFDDYSSSFHDRNLSTDGITGASPQKFKHMSKKLFVDRREVLSIFGGNPGRYHGFEKDLPVGGTYKDTTSKLWSENKSNDG